MSSVDRAEWIRHLEAKAKRRKLEMAPVLRQIAMAEVPAEKLTGLPEWDLFLKVVQDQIDALTEQKQDLLAKFLSRASLSYEQLIALKLEGTAIENRLDVFRKVLDLPSDLTQQARRAKELLRESESVSNAVKS